MKVQKTILVIAAALVLAALCYAQPKKTEIKPGTVVQWTHENTVVITTTVSQSVEREDLLREKQRRLEEIVQLQAQITQRQAQIYEIDLIIAAYTDPNIP